MNKIALLLSGIVILASGYNFELFANTCDLEGTSLEIKTLYKKVYSHYIDFYNKKYTDYEYETRFDTWTKNVRLIKEHNQRNLNYKYGINQFTDKTHEEYKKIFNPSKKVFTNVEFNYQSNGFPQSLDWRTTNNPSSITAVSSVKNQGQCGSCWSFSSAGATEGAWAISGYPLYNLSSQQLVDCSKQNSGCNGGEMDLAFDYIKLNGLCSAESYPYTGTQSTCLKCEPVAKLQGYTDVTEGNETGLFEQLEFGPVSVAIEADQQSFQLYSSGVYDGDCGTNLDHGVLLVGYGTDETSGLDYWIVKNSWGLTWGESGYIRMVRGKNICGIALYASRPYYLNVGY